MSAGYILIALIAAGMAAAFLWAIAIAQDALIADLLDDAQGDCPNVPEGLKAATRETARVGRNNAEQRPSLTQEVIARPHEGTQ